MMKYERYEELRNDAVREIKRMAQQGYNMDDMKEYIHLLDVFCVDLEETVREKVLDSELISD